MMLTKATIVHLILPCVSALIDGQIVTPHHAVNHSGVVTMQVHRKATNSSQHGANRRQIDIGLDDPFYGLSYYVNLQIGSPPQPVVVVLDTGSDELWVNAECSTASFAGGVTWCEANPVYNPALSSSSSEYAPFSPFDFQYGKGFATGDYYIDTVVVGGVPVVTALFGVASSSSEMDSGIWGVCYGYPLYTEYYTVLDLMALDGIIQSRAFGLDLASVDSAQGAVTFGGIDTMRYIGALEKMPIIPYYNSPDGAPRYRIYMSSFGVTRNGKSVTLSAPVYEQAVFLDSGTTLTFLPANIVTNLVTYFPEAVASGSSYIVPCTLRSEASTIDFGFGNTIIHVPFHEAIWQTGTTCVLGVGAASGVNWVLGDTMLRGAYVVYDQDNNNLLLAQAANCGSNIIPISSGVDAVPSVTGACTATTSSSKPSSSSKSSSSSKTSSSTTKTTSTSSIKLSSSTSTINSITSSSSKTISTSFSSSKTISTSSLTSKSSSTSRKSSSSKTTSTSSSSSKSSSTSAKTSASSSSKTSSVATATVTVTKTVTVMPTGTCTSKGQVY